MKRVTPTESKQYKKYSTLENVNGGTILPLLLLRWKLSKKGSKLGLFTV
jgi:hypothetical protein